MAFPAVVSKKNFLSTIGISNADLCGESGSVSIVAASPGRAQNTFKPSGTDKSSDCIFPGFQHMFDISYFVEETLFI